MLYSSNIKHVLTNTKGVYYSFGAEFRMSIGYNFREKWLWLNIDFDDYPELGTLLLL